MTTTTARPRRRRVVGITLAAVGSLLLATVGAVVLGRSDDSSGATLAVSSQRARALAVRSTAPAVLKLTPANRVRNVRPNAPVTVRVAAGTLGAVTLLDSHRHQVQGVTTADGGWQNTELLRPSTAYTLSVAATGSNGVARTVTSTFRTLTPKVDATYSLLPTDSVVGVGMPVVVQFDSAVTTRAQRAEVEKRVKVTSLPVQPGSWGWLDDRQLMFRPERYWKAGTTVSVSTTLHGVQTGDGKWVTTDAARRFTVGASMISTVDMNRHTLTLRRNGVVIRTFPVSTGRPGPTTETRSGIKVVMERAQTVVMDSATIGIPAGSPGSYKITTEWNLRMTWTGEFIHSAPWSVDSQGNTNVSHGCTNMAPGDAEWMFHNSKVGDVVAYTGSGRTFEPLDGYGVWVYKYKNWQARSALPPSVLGRHHRAA